MILIGGIVIIRKAILFSFVVIILLIPVVSAESITIDNSTDIQDSIDKIDDNQIINLEAGNYHKSGIEVKKNLTLQGNDLPEKVIIDADNKDSIIKVMNSDVKLTVKNITFINALNNENNGGAIQFYSTGELIIENCIFISNKVTTSVGEGLGGGIYAHGSENDYVTVTVRDSKFLNNYAYTDGGAINTKFGILTVSNCLFDNNSATRDGGAIGTRGLADVNIMNSVFSNNHALEWGGAINNWLAKYTIDGCEFISNSAEEGGAVANCGSLTKITNSRFINNTADEGGVLHSHKDAFNITVIASENEFINNSANKGSSIFMQTYTQGSFDFENNYWGSNNPDWTKEFYTNGVCPNPTNWLKTVNSTITAGDLKRAYNSPYDFKAVFSDEIGRPLKNTQVTFKLNNQKYNVTTDLNGVAHLFLKLNAGTYSVTSVNPVSGEECVNTVNIVKRIVENKDINAYYLNGVYKIRIIDDDGNPVKANENVVVKIGKSTYRIKTDSKGYASLKLTQIPGRYSVSAVYNGYTVKNTLNIKQVLKASDISKKKAKTIKYSVKLIGKDNKNKKITFKINGKTYSSKTNAKGKATVSLKNLKRGSNKITIRYINDSVKKTIKIK